jgi:PleD family two-component response regulator
VHGEVTLGDLVLTAGDGAAVTTERAVSLTARHAARPERHLQQGNHERHCGRKEGGNVARQRSIILVDATPRRRAPVADAFRSAGYDVVEAATPAEAVMRLADSTDEPELIALAETLPETAAEELRELLLQARASSSR